MTVESHPGVFLSSLVGPIVAPERLIEGGLPTEATVASVLVAKYACHLPLYRQAQMLAAQGLDIKRAVLAFWVGYAAAELICRVEEVPGGARLSRGDRRSLLLGLSGSRACRGVGRGQAEE